MAASTRLSAHRYIDNGTNECSSCGRRAHAHLDSDAGTVHDHDAPVTTGEIREHHLARDAQFVDAHHLEPGDHVHDDGTITRITEISTRYPPRPGGENGSGTSGRPLVNSTT